MLQKVLDRLKSAAKGARYNRLSYVQVESSLLLEMIHELEFGKYLHEKMQPHMTVYVNQTLEKLKCSPQS